MCSAHNKTKSITFLFYEKKKKQFYTRGAAVPNGKPLNHQYYSIFSTLVSDAASILPLFSSIQSAISFFKEFIFYHNIFSIVFDTLEGPFSILPAKWAALGIFTIWTWEMATRARIIEAVANIHSVCSVSALFIKHCCWAALRLIGLCIALARQFPLFTCGFFWIKIR